MTHFKDTLDLAKKYRSTNMNLGQAHEETYL